MDAAGDAWVTDFGGGRTEGWVDRDKAGTIEEICKAFEQSWTLLTRGKSLRSYLEQKFLVGTNGSVSVLLRKLAL